MDCSICLEDNCGCCLFECQHNAVCLPCFALLEDIRCPICRNGRLNKNGKRLKENTASFMAGSTPEDKRQRHFAKLQEKFGRTAFREFSNFEIKMFLGMNHELPRKYKDIFLIFEGERAVFWGPKGKLGLALYLNDSRGIDHWGANNAMRNAFCQCGYCDDY